MKTSKKVIQVLEEALASEHTALVQYMAHHYAADAAGYSKLAAIIKKGSIEEMKHAEHLAERLTFLGMTPPYRLIKPPMMKGDLVAQIKSDVALEEEAIAMYNRAINICLDEGDAGSRALLEQILPEEEKHLEELRQVLDHAAKHGDAYWVSLI